MQMVDIPLGARKQIIDAQHLMPKIQQPIDEMRSQEPSAAGDKNTLSAFIKSRQGTAPSLEGCNCDEKSPPND